MTLSDKIIASLKRKDMETLKHLLTGSGDAEVLEALHTLSSKEQVIAFRLLAKDKALAIFEQLDTDDQHNLLNSFTDAQVIEFVNELAPDDRVKLLDELPAKVVKKILAELSPKEREMTNLLMGYEAHTAGRIMTPEYMRINRNMTVAEALEKIKESAKEKETIYTIYITDDARELEGVVSFRDLWIADATEKVENVMQKIVAKVSTDTDQEEVAKLLQRLDLLAIPVTDKENRLVGIVTIDDAVDILEEEATEDLFIQAGMVDVQNSEADLSETMVRGNLWSIWKVRVPFLFITLAAGFLGGLIIEGFEEALAAIIGVAFFIPLVMDMGGNVGTQSSTVFARGIVLGHIDIKRFFRFIAKETGVGLSMGLLFGGISAVIAGFWQGDFMLGLAVGMSVAFVMALAAALGFLVPFILVKLKMDQAAGSAPLITSVKDIVGLLVYFLAVATFMGHVLAAASDYEVIEVRVTAAGFYFSLDPEEETATVLGRAEYKFDIVIPEEIMALGELFTVTEIGDEAFRDNGLTGLELPGTIEVIGSNAFRANYLTSIYLPASIQEIGNNAFRDNQLTYLNLYYEIEDFGDDIFRQNLLTEIVIPKWMTEVFEGTFRQNQLTSIIFHDSVEIIGEDAFMSNLFTEIILPDSLLEIEEDGFRDNLLTHVVLPDSLRTIGYRAFMDNELVSIVIPSSVIEWTLHPETGQGDHFNNNPLERIYTDLNNASALADMLTVEVLGEITVTTITILDTGGAVYQRNNRVANPVWE